MTAALLKSLGDPACFAHQPAEVQIVQTHMSIVCLAGELVYKLKKAVTFPFADFSRLAERRRLCREEVRLNRRLCPDTYLGTAALRRTASGGVAFSALGDDEGPDDLDVAVVMQRLPAQRMLDELVRHRAVCPAEIEALARHVAAFHARAESGPEVVRLADPHRLVAFAAANFTELRAMPGHALPGPLLEALAAASAGDFARLLPVLVRRVAAGCAVDGHGDLHTRNVCMTEPPAVYDCIEFEPAFRIGDVATENAFLAMDLRYRGAADLARVYVETYAAARGDSEMPALLPTLCAYRAMVRAKIASLAAADPELPAADRTGARHSAWRHLMLAAAYSVEQRGPWWVVVCGPPASGKTRLCRTLAEVAHWPHVATDAVRKELAGIAADRPAGPEHYTDAFSQRTYAELVARAALCTQRGELVVLLDGNFATPDLRRHAFTGARNAGARMLVACVEVDAATAAARAAARQRESGNVSDAGPELAIALRARFVPPTAAEGGPVQALDGGGGGDLAAIVMAALLDGQCA
jgi:aminoglycoside phosphotransferase family enzyme/predicted kinase